MQWYHYCLFFAAMLVGAALLWLCQRLLKSSLPKWRRERMQRRFNTLYHSDKVRNWLTRYYTRRDCAGELYEYDGGERRILCLSNPSWLSCDEDVMELPQLITVDYGKRKPFQVNTKMIERRKQSGQTLFNDDCIVLYAAADPLHFRAKKSEYYEKLSFIDALEQETLRCAAGSLRRRRPELRDGCFPDFARAVAPSELPRSLGCNVAFVITRQGTRQILLHVRSKKTFIYGGSYSVFPNFGLAPLPDEQPRNVLLYNVLKEYCEELFGHENLERDQGKIDPLWFYRDIPEAKELLACLNGGTAHCRYLGYSVDAVNGLGVLSVLLYIQDEEQSERIFHKGKPNWEVKNARFMLLDDPGLQQKIDDGEFQSTAALTVCLARQALERLDKHGKFGVCRPGE